MAPSKPRPGGVMDATVLEVRPLGGDLPDDKATRFCTAELAKLYRRKGGRLPATARRPSAIFAALARELSRLRSPAAAALAVGGRWQNPWGVALRRHLVATAFPKRGGPQLWLARVALVAADAEAANVLAWARTLRTFKRTFSARVVGAKQLLNVSLVVRGKKGVLEVVAERAALSGLKKGQAERLTGLRLPR